MPETDEHLLAPIRPAQLADLRDVAMLQAASLNSAWSVNEWRQLLTPTTSGACSVTVFLYVSRIRTTDRSIGRLAGFLFARRVADEAEILAVAVDRSCRRQGIGQRLLNRLIGELRCDGPCRLLLEVSVDNEPALALYEENGFTEVGLRMEYYATPGRKPVDAKLLARDLAD
ncbi:MAG: GNAT family N-acetyltransferase [Hyphomicrobiaceae bacterium]